MRDDQLRAEQRPLVDVFAPGVAFAHPRLGRLEPRITSLGSLVSSRGRLGACDPMTTDLSAVFAGKVSAGTHAVDGAWVLLGEDRWRLAAVRVWVGAPISEEERLQTAHDLIDDVVPASFVGAAAAGIAYASDGYGCIVDPDRSAALDGAAPRQRLQSALSPLTGETDSKAIFSFAGHPDDDTALIAFVAGTGGEGGPQVFANYWGRDSNGDVVALWTDFGLLHTGAFESIHLAAPLSPGPIEHPLLRANKLTLRVPRWGRRRLVATGPLAELGSLRVGAAPQSSVQVTSSPATLHPRGMKRVFYIEGDGALAVDVLMGERPLATI